jgi:small-conductance mechanosensitive channel
MNFLQSDPSLKFELEAILEWLLGVPLRLLLIAVLALILRSVATRAISKAMAKISTAKLIPGKNQSISRQRERANTAGTVLKSVTNTTIALFALGTILSELGMDLAPLIAAAGVLGIAAGLGAQTLIRDFISGLFMLVEDQYGVGDEVQVLDISGIVESVGLRITTIRDSNGTLWYLRNGEILKLGNKSKKYN